VDAFEECARCCRNRVWILGLFLFLCLFLYAGFLLFQKRDYVSGCSAVILTGMQMLATAGLGEN